MWLALDGPESFATDIARSLRLVVDHLLLVGFFSRWAFSTLLATDLAGLGVVDGHSWFLSLYISLSNCTVQACLWPSIWGG